MWYHLRKRRSRVKLNKALPPDFLGKYQQSRSRYVRIINVYEEDVSETLEWIEGVTGRRTRAVVATVSELLTFAENTDTKVVILETVAETLALTESPNYTITQPTVITASVSESLALSEILVIEKVTTTTYNVSDTLGLFEQVEVTNVIGAGYIQVNTSETLYISESVFAVGTYAVGDTLTFSESFGYERAVSDTLVLTEDHQLEYPLNDLLTLTESATTEYDVAVSDTLNLTEIAYSLTISTCQENFDPEPPLGIRANTTLSYPYSASTHTVTLRNPEFGNKQTQDMSSVIRMTRGGEQITFRDSTWPTIVYLDVSFTRVTRAQRDDFIALLVAAAGDQIKLEDWENRTWKGHIASEPNEVLEMLNNEYELRFKFEGALQ